MALDNLNSFILFILCLHDMYFLPNFTFQDAYRGLVYIVVNEYIMLRALKFRRCLKATKYLQNQEMAINRSLT